MKTNHEFMQSQSGVQFTTYGWPVSDERANPTVFLEFAVIPLCAKSTMSPIEARRLAANLIACADSAEAAK